MKTCYCLRTEKEKKPNKIVHKRLIFLTGSLRLSFIVHLLPEILLCVAEEKQPPILGEPSNSSWTSIWQCLPFSPMIQRIQGKPASAVDIPAPMVETSAGVCPELPPPFYLFKTPQFTFLVLLHYSLEGHTQLHCGTFNAWQQDKLLHKTQSPLPHLLNTQAQADTHTHTHSQNIRGQRRPKGSSAFSVQGKWGWRDYESCILSPK